MSYLRMSSFDPLCFKLAYSNFNSSKSNRLMFKLALIKREIHYFNKKNKKNGTVKQRTIIWYILVN